MEASAVSRAAPAGVSVMIQSPNLLRLTSDARLVTLVRQRNARAFEVVYNRHHRAILSFCRHMLGDPQEAEDAVQHTFLAAYNDLIDSQKQIHLRAWLFTIARNRCYSVLRGRREQPASDLGEPITEGLASQVQRRQDLRDLVVDMQRLPEEQRAALVLAELDALSHDQIAEALGVPRDKVKALVFQARESLVASRAARETDCSEIREQLATQRGGALRRANLRRHLRECAGCRDFRRQIERQRRQLAVLLPVAPTIALREGILAAGAGGGAAAGLAGAGAGGAVFSTMLKSGVVKVTLGALAAGVGTAGTLVVAQDIPSVFTTSSPPPSSAPASPAVGASGQSPSAVHAAVARLRYVPVARPIHTTTRSAINPGAGNPLLSPWLSPIGPTRSVARALWIRNSSLPLALALSGASSPIVVVSPTMPQIPAPLPAGAAPPVTVVSAPVVAAPAPAAPPVVVTAPQPSGQKSVTPGSGRGNGAWSSATGSASAGVYGPVSGVGRHGGGDAGSGGSSTHSSGSTGAPAGTTRGSGAGNGPAPAGSGGSSAGSSGSSAGGTTSGTGSGAGSTSGTGGTSGTTGTGTSGTSSSSGTGTTSTSGSSGTGTTSTSSSGTTSSSGSGTSTSAGADLTKAADSVVSTQPVVGVTSSGAAAAK